MTMWVTLLRKIVEPENKSKRRSHWQALAHTRYRRMTYRGGDGQQIVMTMCVEPWTYKLHNDYVEAACARNRSCGPSCQGASFHKHWKLIDAAERKAREELSAKLAAKEHKQLSADSTASFWESKLGISGVD